MYLHCHSCDWSQDDFWEPNGYNPFRKDLVNNLRENLFKERIYLDRNFFEEANEGQDGVLPYQEDINGWYCSGTDYVAYELYCKLKSVKNMAVKTWEQWNIVKDVFVCPKCGQKNLDID